MASYAFPVPDYIRMSQRLIDPTCRDDDDRHTRQRGASDIGVRMKSILDPSFRYTSSLHTDVRKTFQRVRRELLRGPAAPVVRGDVSTNVVAMQRRSASPR